MDRSQICRARAYNQNCTGGPTVRNAGSSTGLRPQGGWYPRQKCRNCCFLLLCRGHVLVLCSDATNTRRQASSDDQTTTIRPASFSGVTSSGLPASSSGINSSGCVFLLYGLFILSILYCFLYSILNLFPYSIVYSTCTIFCPVFYFIF